jgi:hypothetical protein
MLTQVTPRTLVNNVAVAVLFGVVVPWVKGIEYLDLFLLLPYALLSLFFVMPLVVNAVFAGGGTGVPLRAFFRAVLTGWFTGTCVLWMGIATVSVRVGRFVAPPVAVGLALAVLSLFACLLAGALAAWTANRVDDDAAAKGRLRIGLLVLLAAFFAVPRFLHEDTVAWLLDFLTPEGLVRATMGFVPVAAIASVLLLTRVSRR